jgi:transcription elongation factor GreA
MSPDIQYLTTEKFEELRKELDYLKSERRKEIAEKLEYAKKLGDLSENAEYHSAREEQAEIEDRISRLENLLKYAVITKGNGGDTINVGSTVTVTKEGSAASTYVIVGSEEADMAKGKVSNMSPLGSALLGHKAGDTVQVKTPKGMADFKINSVK